MRPLTDDATQADGRVPRPAVPRVPRRACCATQGFERVLMLLGYLAEVDQRPLRRRQRPRDRHRLLASPRADDLTAERMQTRAERLDSTRFLLHVLRQLLADALRRHVGAATSRSGCSGSGDGLRQPRWLHAEQRARDRDGMVEVFDRSRTTPGLTGVEIGYAILERDRARPAASRRSEELLSSRRVYPVLARARRARRRTGPSTATTAWARSSACR